MNTHDDDNVATAEPGSYRDPDSAVFRIGDRVLRGLSDRGAADWHRLEGSTAFRTLVDQGSLIGTRTVDEPGARSPRGTAWSEILEHDAVPTVTYPYEWPFAMLRDAALCELDVLAAALEDGLTLKDGTIYNVQFVGSRPVFIDIGSFTRGDGPWPGYRQFCETALFPLLMHAHLGLAHQALMRGRIDGVPAADARAVFRGRRIWSKGVFKHVVLQAALQAKVTASSEATKQSLASAGATIEIAKATARSLRKLVAALDVSKDRSTWSDYRTTCTYTSESAAFKRAFVEAAATAQPARQILDLGANDGEYSVVVAPHCEQVIACDFDELVVDRLYRRLRAEGPANVLPLVMDLTDPSPGIGWNGTERAAWADRVRPDLALALALIHHLCIGANVPLPMVVDWLHRFGGRVVVEWVDPTDPQAQRLLANKPAGLFGDYTQERFEALLAERFTTVRRADVPGQPRTLYELAART